MKKGVEKMIIDLQDNNKDIERDEIVKNILPIKNLAQLSYNIYQDEDLIENENKANDCLKYLIENLNEVYNFIEGLDEVSRDIDLYQVGDVINFLKTIEIREVE